VFFIDFAGHIEDEASINVLSELTENVVDLKVLGSYPRAVL
jgi:chorismate mutase/prephenate dehydratase